MIRTLFLPSIFSPLNFFLSDWFCKPSNIPLSLFIHWGLPWSNGVLHATVLNLYPKLWWVCFFCLSAFLHNSYTRPQTVLSPSAGSGCRSDSLCQWPVSSSLEILWLLCHLEHNTTSKKTKNSSSVHLLHFFIVLSLQKIENWEL